MTMLASPASDRAMARQATENGKPPAGTQEIKYRQDAANYVAAMVAELRQIAGKAGFDKLVRALDSAYYEAYGALDGRLPESPPADETERREKISNSMEPNGA